jgi:hypothetical protein
VTKSYSAFLIACLAPGAFAADVSFDALLSEPRRYHHRHVTVTGIAEIGGGLDFALWRDAAARRHGNLKKVITVLHRQDEMERALRSGKGIAPHSGANLRWVKITGMVDTDLRGRFGDEPFQLLLEKLQVLPGRRLYEFLPVIGFFRNDSSEEVRFTLYDTLGHFAGETGAGPHGISQIGVKKGTAVVTTLGGKKLAACPTADSRYFDPAKKSYYFTFASGKIEPVFPRDAISWSLGYLGDRD